jgi:hypothetical protein
MSDIQLDKDVISDGRKDTLKDVEAPLRDQIVQKLFNSLVEMKIGQKVSNMWHKGSANREAWLERQKEYLAHWDEYLVNDASGSFEGSSQLHLPMAFTVCKTAHARFMQALWQDPPLHTKADNEASIERVPVVQDTMRYYLMKGANYNAGCRRTVDMWVWDWITTGSGIMKWRWDVQYERYLDVANVQERAPSLFKPAEDGSIQEIPQFKMVEKEVEKVDKCFDGPVLDLVNMEDILIIGGGGDPDLADAVLHKQELTASELWTLVDRKVFNRAAVEKIIEGGPDSREGDTGGDVKTQRAHHAGQAGLETEADLDRYTIMESHLKLDVNGSGINTGVIAWIHPRSCELVRATYSRRVNKTGKRPFIKADFQVRKNQEFGVGLVELMYPLTKELDAMHNMRIDFGLISVMPIGFYRPASGIDPENIQFEPGQLIPVENPQTDVVFPQMGNRTAFGAQEEASLMQMIERLTSISDLNMGVNSSQGALRTATGARGMLGEMSANLDVYLGRLNDGWGKALRYLLHMLQQRIPPGLSFRITGDTGQDYWRTVRNAEDIAGNFDIEVSPNSASSNPAIQAEQASSIMQMVSNPLAIQMGVVGPGQFYEAYKNQLMSLGVRDWGRYALKPDGYERTMTPEEEANRLLRGMEVPVMPNADHEGFIQFYEMFEGDDELMGQFSVEQIGLLKIQAMKHAQMIQALQQQQAQAANVSQMKQNAQMGSSPAPTGAPVAPAGPAPVAQGA